MITRDVSLIKSWLAMGLPVWYRLTQYDEWKLVYRDYWFNEWQTKSENQYTITPPNDHHTPNTP